MRITANRDLKSNSSEKARFTRDPFHGIFFAESCPFSKKIRSHASRKGRHPYQSACRKHDPCYCLFLEEIGLKNGVALHEIFRQAKKIGCRPCPENTGLFLRLAWKSQPQSRSSVLSGTHRSPEQSVVVLSEETERDDAFPKGLYLRNADGILWLHGYAYDPAYRFSGADLFAFEKISSPSSN